MKSVTQLALEPATLIFEFSKSRSALALQVAIVSGFAKKVLAFGEKWDIFSLS